MTDDEETPVLDDLDAVGDELTAAQRELRESLSLACEYVSHLAAEDRLAALVHQQITAAFDRVRVANIAATTYLREQPTHD